MLLFSIWNQNEWASKSKNIKYRQCWKSSFALVFYIYIIHKHNFPTFFFMFMCVFVYECIVHFVASKQKHENDKYEFVCCWCHLHFSFFLLLIFYIFYFHICIVASISQCKLPYNIVMVYEMNTALWIECKLNDAHIWIHSFMQHFTLFKKNWRHFSLFLVYLKINNKR